MAKRQKYFKCSECEVEYYTVELRTICNNCLDKLSNKFDQQNEKCNKHNRG